MALLNENADQRNLDNNRKDSAFFTNSATTNAERLNQIEAPTITLPKGGGSIKSIDEKFAVNAVNGTAGLSIPLPFSSARGFSPELTLSYSSGSGNSVFGLGWSINIPAIKRKTANELPRYYDESDSDTYIFSGAEDLVPEFIKDSLTGLPVADQYGNFKKNDFSTADGLFTIRRYNPRIEEGFARIERWTESLSGIIHWRVISKDNHTLLFGLRPQSRISDPENPIKIFEWLADMSFDDKGNCALYQYQMEDGAGMDMSRLSNKNRLNGYAKFTNTYITDIKYGNTIPYYGNGTELYANNATALYTDADYVIAGSFMFETVFDYSRQMPIDYNYNQQSPEDFLYDDSQAWVFRSDAFSQYLSGFEIRNCRLCYRVLLYHNFKELPGGSALVKALDFEYTSNGNEGFTFLSQARLTGFIKQNDKDGTSTYTAKSYPPFTFDYQKIAWNTELQAISRDNLQNAPSGIDEKVYKFTDLYSDGLAGILTEQAGALYYKSNLTKGEFTPAALVSPKPSFQGFGKVMQLMDLEGNGSKQLVNWQNEPNGYFDLDDENEWQPFQSFRHFPNVNFSDANTRLLDLDGDGRADILITEDDVFTWYPSEGKAGFEQARKLPRIYDEEKGPAILFAEPLQTVFLADMSGDSKTDIVRIRNGEICYWPNLGYGKFGAKVSMDKAPIFDHIDNFNPAYIKLADIDGSGTADVVYSGRNYFTIWLNQSGNYFSAPKVINNFPAIDNLNNVSVLDLLGTGLGCLVWNSVLPGDAGSPLRYIDLMNSTKPHLMVSYKNNMGKETNMVYTPSSMFYVLDKQAGNPWITKIPFITYCVSKLVTYDRIMKTRLASTFSYHHGYYDHYEKEFRGFGRVEQLDCEEIDDFVLNSPGASNNVTEQDINQWPVLTKTWFHTGAFLLKDKILNQFAHEYFQNPSIENLLPEPQLPAGLSIDEWREALRACKGTALRKEVYGLDGSLLQDIPYSAEQHNLIIKILQPRNENKYAVCLVHESESIAYHYERNATDPRIAHEMIFDIDPYGNILHSASIVYPRLGISDDVDPLIKQEQQKLHILYHQFIYTDPILTGEDYYRTPLIFSAKSFELNNLPGPEALQVFAGTMLVPYYKLPSLGSYCASLFPLIASASPAANLIEYTRTLYCDDMDSSMMLSPGTMGIKALVYETYKAAFNLDMLSALNIPGFNPATIDTMLQDVTQGAYELSEGYYWITSGRHNYDTAHFYLPTLYTDPFGNLTTIIYDSDYFLYIQNSTDALNNKATVSGFNFRTLSPYYITDVNANRSGARFDELGMVVNSFVMGKQSEQKGDYMDAGQVEVSVLDQPTVILEYVVDNWFNQTNAIGFDSSSYYKPQPNFVYVKARTAHYFAEDGSVNADAAIWQETYAYSDGGGHEILKKVQADPGDALGVDAEGNIVTLKNSPRWIGNGRLILNNKGNPIKQYQPYFSAGIQFDDEKDMVELGVTEILYYDAPGRVVQTLFPDGTFSKVEFNPWKQLSYDQNDTVIDSLWFKNLKPDLTQPSPSDPEMRAAWYAAQNYDTPGITYLDTLGRVIVTEQRTTMTGGVISKSMLDIQGNVLQVIDANNNIVMDFRYDMLQRHLYQNSMDAGQRWMLINVAGKPLQKWDERSQVFDFTYDKLLRPLSSRVMGGDGPKPLNNIYQQYIYGETLPTATAQAQNLLGKPYMVYDQAGLITNNENDFKGNLLSATRQFNQDYKNIPDWGLPVPGTQLDTTVSYPNTFSYDALNRVSQSSTPDNSLTAYTYNLTGLLQTLSVTQPGIAPRQLVKNINYDAKGQRTGIQYGNGAYTAYQYDVNTFRLIRLRTNDANNNTIQDLLYTYDPVGNIMQQTDHCTPVAFFNNYEVNGDLLYTYDRLYQLVSASGREHAGQVNFGTSDNWNDVSFMISCRPNDTLTWQNYTENYTYDQVGNIKQISHAVAGGIGWTRNYNYETLNNRLAGTNVGADAYSYSYHPQHGFITSMPHLQVMAWNFADQLSSVAAQKVNSGTPETTWYVYDSTGQRVRKITENSAAAGQNPTLKSERIYVGGIEIYSQFSGTNAGLVRKSLQVMDDKRRIAMIETRNAVDDGTTQLLVRYQVGNHLGSSSLELNDTSAIISYEEYHPYGTTAYQAMNISIRAAAKRYRYSGMERDEESGLNYHHARYYIPWLGRWTAPDPIGLDGGINLYAYVQGRPVTNVDPEGTDDNPLQLFFSEHSVYDQVAIATKRGRGFLASHYENAKKLVQMWGGPKKYDLGHIDKAFVDTKAGEAGRIRIQESGFNRSQGAGTEKLSPNKVRNAEGVDLAAKDGVRNPSPPENAAIESKEFQQWEPAKPQATATETAQAAAHEGSQAAAHETAQLSLFETTQAATKETAQVAAHEATQVAVKEATQIAAKETATIVAKEASQSAFRTALKVTAKVGKKAAKFVPFVGVGIGVALVTNDLKNHEYASAALDAAEAIPVVGDVVGAAHLGVSSGHVLSALGENVAAEHGSIVENALTSRGISKDNAVLFGAAAAGLSAITVAPSIAIKRKFMALFN